MTSGISGSGTWTDGGLLQWILHFCISCVSAVSHQALNTVCSLNFFYNFSPPSPTSHIEATPYLSWITLFSDLFHVSLLGPHPHEQCKEHGLYALGFHL